MGNAWTTVLGILLDCNTQEAGCSSETFTQLKSQSQTPNWFIYSDIIAATPGGFFLSKVAKVFFHKYFFFGQPSFYLNNYPVFNWLIDRSNQHGVVHLEAFKTVSLDFTAGEQRFSFAFKTLSYFCFVSASVLSSLLLSLSVLSTILCLEQSLLHFSH